MREEPEPRDEEVEWDAEANWAKEESAGANYTDHFELISRPHSETAAPDWRRGKWCYIIFIPNVFPSYGGESSFMCVLLERVIRRSSRSQEGRSSPNYIWYAYAFLCCVVRIFEWHSHSVKNIPMANNVYSHQKGDEKQRRQRHKSKWPCLCARRQLEERESALWSPLRRQLIRLGKIKSPSLVLLTIKRFIIMRHRARPPVLLSADWFSLPAALSTSLLQSACIYSAHKDNVFAKKKMKTAGFIFNGPGPYILMMIKVDLPYRRNRCCCFRCAGRSSARAISVIRRSSRTGGAPFPSEIRRRARPIGKPDPTHDYQRHHCRHFRPPTSDW